MWDSSLIGIIVSLPPPYDVWSILLLLFIFETVTTYSKCIFILVVKGISTVRCRYSVVVGVVNCSVWGLAVVRRENEWMCGLGCRAPWKCHDLSLWRCRSRSRHCVYVMPQWPELRKVNASLSLSYLSQCFVQLSDLSREVYSYTFFQSQIFASKLYQRWSQQSRWWEWVRVKQWPSSLVGGRRKRKGRNK